MLAALLLCSVALAVGAAEAAPDFAPARKVADKALVRVRTTVAIGTDPAQGPATFTNTGFLISRDGYVVTSLLAVAGSSRVQVVGADGKALDARLIAMDQPAGLALLKCDLSDATPLQFSSEHPAVGQWVALGFAGRSGPDASPTSLQQARVVALDAAIHLNGYRWRGLMRATTRICNGCASGPLLDRDGRVVGVVIAARCEEPFTSVWQACDAYGLPADKVRAIVDRMRRGESRRLGWLGVAVEQEPGERQGARVAAVLERSPAHTAGIRPGDVVLQINGTPVEAPIGVAEILAETGPAPNTSIKLLRRDGSVVQVTADLQPRPLAICAAPPHMRAAAPVTVQQLIEDNHRLQARVEELEGTCQQLQDRLNQIQSEQAK